MNQNLCRLGNRVINLEAIAEAHFEPDEREANIACHIWCRSDGCITLTGKDAQQFWRLLKHCSVNITPVEAPSETAVP